MLRPILLLLIFSIYHRVLTAQEFVSPSYNTILKKIDKKIDILNNLPSTFILGYAPIGNTNDRKFMKPSVDIDTWLNQVVYQQFDTSKDSKAKKLLWVIHDISVGKDSLQRDSYAFVKLKADIYDNSKHDDLQYEWVNTFDSTWVVSNKAADFGAMVANAFNELYKHSIDLKNTKANVRYQVANSRFTGTKEDIVKKLQLSNNHPILKDSVYTDGIYTTFTEFKNNAPAITRFYAATNDKNKAVELYQLISDSSSNLIEKAWGISVNNELYFYNAGQLYPIEKAANGIYIAKYLEPRMRRNQALYWRQYIGKWQGDDNPYNNAHVLKKNVTKDISIEATHLDFDLEDFIY